jgi:hypothetical protein
MQDAQRADALIAGLPPPMVQDRQRIPESVEPRELKGICQRPLDRAAPFALRLEIVVDHRQAGGPALRLMVTA